MHRRRRRSVVVKWAKEVSGWWVKLSATMQADNQQIHGKVNRQGCSPRAPLILLGDWSEMEKKNHLMHLRGPSSLLPFPFPFLPPMPPKSHLQALCHLIISFSGPVIFPALTATPWRFDANVGQLSTFSYMPTLITLLC